MTEFYVVFVTMERILTSRALTNFTLWYIMIDVIMDAHEPITLQILPYLDYIV